MKMKRPFSLRRVGKEWNRENILRFLGYILAAFVINLALECLSRRSLGDGLHYMVTRPWQFFYDSLIILFTLSLSLLFRKRSFCFLLFAAVWIGLGLANCILLGFRATPLTAPDIWLLSSVRDIIEIYMSQPVLILLMLGIAALIGVIVLLWLRTKKTRPSYYFAAVQVLLCGVILAGFTVAFLRSGTLASHFPNLPDAYDSNGFAYCFSASAVTQGISEPDGYSQEAIDVLLSEQDDLPADRVRTPNFIFVQLESFFDANYLKDLTYGENPVPNFERLKETCSSGLFYVPSIGAGTANTEFEVITQMNVHDFGTGEYPYKTILQETPCESIAYDLKKLGLASHVIHNNTATFYDRNIVFPKLGFDSFTTLEYMNHVETNEIGWAKDKILTKEIVRALSETEERDLIYTISVQPHGAYPEESETADIKVLSGIEDPALRGQLEYYATQIHEVDEFLRTLTDVLTTWEEPTVLVLYGDHMPSLEISKDMLDLSAGGLFETEYVIWSNCGVVGADRNVKAYQLSSRVLELLDINVGTLTKFHQLNPWRGAYETELRTLQYDMLYGDRVVYHGEQPFEETDMRFGTRDITVNTAYVRNDMLMVRGKNFTPYSVIYVDGNAKETTFLSEYAVTCAADGIEKGDRVTVRQVAEDGTELSEAIADPYGD